VLIGVAIGDTNLVSSAKSGIVHDLNSEVGEARQQAGQLRGQLSEEEAFAGGLYPLAVHELLRGRSVGLVFLGGSSDTANALVRAAVTQAGGDLSTVVAVREPLDLSAIARDAAGTRFGTLGESSELVASFGEIAGRQLASGGRLVGRELLSRVRGSLLSAFDGQLQKLNGVVVMRADPSGMTPAQTEASAAFESGLLNGVSAAGATIVGVQLKDTEPSQIPWYKGRNLSSVDDLDALAGQAALVYALAGHHGAFGAKSTADSLLPSPEGTTTGP
jgi:Copper transport outer membrane protein, MctB